MSARNPMRWSIEALLVNVLQRGTYERLDRVEVIGNYLAEHVDRCTCSVGHAPGPHENGCGLEPLCALEDLRPPTDADIDTAAAEFAADALHRTGAPTFTAHDLDAAFAAGARWARRG